MAVYPTDKGSPGTWGAECSAYHAVSTDLDTGKIKNEALQVADTAPIADAALANKKYVDGLTLWNLNGSNVVVYTKAFSGSLPSAQADVSVAHGIAGGTVNILNVTACIFNDVANTFFVYDILGPDTAVGSYSLRWDATNVYFDTIGTSLQGNGYRIKIDYRL